MIAGGTDCWHQDQQPRLAQQQMDSTCLRSSARRRDCETVALLSVLPLTPSWSQGPINQLRRNIIVMMIKFMRCIPEAFAGGSVPLRNGLSLRARGLDEGTRKGFSEV